MIFLIFLACFASSNAYIALYGDVHKDVVFFTRTFPWIIDNIGGELYVDYYLLGSGRYSVPQACALRDLQGNNFLQAQYLRCEAKGYPSEYCLCEAGINSHSFKECVAKGGHLASTASAKYSVLGTNITPIVELEPNNTVHGVDDVTFLQKICTIFGDYLPRGCVHYSNQTDSFLAQKALAQFDRDCLKEFPLEEDRPVTPSTDPPTGPPTDATEPDNWWSTTVRPWESTTSSPWPWWSTTSTPWGSTTSRPWESTTSPPWPWWSTTSPPSGSTTARPWESTSSQPWWSSTSRPTTSTPWPWWSTTSPPWESTTSRPWESTSSQPWWSSTSRPTTSPPWPWWSTTSPPWGSTTSRPWESTSSQPWWSTTARPWESTTSPPWPWWSTTSPPWGGNDVTSVVGDDVFDGWNYATVGDAQRSQ